MKYNVDFNNFWEKALRKYRFVIMSSDSFEEKLSIKLSRLNFFAFLGFILFLGILSTVIVVTTTPLAEYIPGRSKTEVQENLVLLTLKADSLEKRLNTQNIYLKNLRAIIAGEELVSPTTNVSEKIKDSDISFKRSLEDSLLRVSVEEEEKGSLFEDKKESSKVFVFMPPIQGLITDVFNLSEEHFGIDLVAKEQTKISSVLDGTVIVSHWSSENGYVIGVQHSGGYFSLYKHNSILLKSVGDFVNAGDYISIIGNSGELSSGPHLHFELWHEGVPLNPQNYILF